MSKYHTVTSLRRTEDVALGIARGRVAGHHVVTINGSVITDTDDSTVWNNGGIYTYPSSASTMSVSSSSANDVSTSSGASVVFVSGLDTNYNAISEYVTLNGQSAVYTTNQYLRINGLNVVQGSANEGNIYIGTGAVIAGVPAAIYGEVVTGYVNSLQGFYTVPANYDAYVYYGSLATGTTASNKYVIGKLMVRPFGGVMGVVMKTTLATGINNFNFPLPLRVASKSDIETRAMSSSGTDDVASVVQLVLVHHDDGVFD